MRQLIILTILTLLIPINHPPVSTMKEPLSSQESDDGAVVCPPDVYIIAPDDCSPLGPTETITSGLAEGISYPISPLPEYPPALTLNSLPYHYYKVNKLGTSLYSSLDSAISNSPSGHLTPGLLYISYVDSASTNNGLFFLTRGGYWIAADGARAGYSTFQGRLFSSQPERSFGWVLSQTQSLVTPDSNGQTTGHTWYRYNFVQIYDTKVVDDVSWNLVGPNEWLPSRFVARVDPHTNVPDGVTGNRWIEVNLYEQTVSVYDNSRLVFATLASTGVTGLWTRPGVFQIYEKDATYNMSGSTTPDLSDYYYLEDVPWTMYFDQRRALHGAYWHNDFGYQLSHGCVNLSIGDSHWLYDWANLGDYVYVYDPSGKTPTDATDYGAGAP